MSAVSGAAGSQRQLTGKSAANVLEWTIALARFTTLGTVSKWSHGDAE